MLSIVSVVFEKCGLLVVPLVLHSLSSKTLEMQRML